MEMIQGREALLHPCLRAAVRSYKESKMFSKVYLKLAINFQRVRIIQTEYVS